MPVFISHSFENKPEFDNIADALEQHGIDYWKPESLKAGASLSEQLRAAIAESEVCVFVATRHSVVSNWCGAELGAFWGAAKPVIIWVAEASLQEAELPRQFQGQLFERRISRVVESVKPHLAPKPAPATELVEANLVASMSRSEFQNLIAETLEHVQDVSFVGSTLSGIAEALSHVESYDALTPEQLREFRQMLSSLLGVADARLQEGAKNSRFFNVLSFVTDTGRWSALARRYEPHPNDRAPIGYYKDCVLWRSGAGQRVETVALASTMVDHDQHGIVDVPGTTLTVGRGTIGKVLWG